MNFASYRIIPKKTIKLHEFYRPLINMIGDSRSKIHSNHNSSTIYNIDYDRLGVLGELAFQVLTGVPMNTQLLPHGDQYDFLINGFAIDVKSSSRSNPRLYVKPHRLNNSFIYVIGHANLNSLTVTFYGWVYGLTIRTCGNTTVLHNLTTYYLEANKLTSMEALENVLEIKYCV
jgi:hypothetical protein